MKRPTVLPLPRAPRVTETQRFLLLSILIGIFAGLLVVCFHFAIDLIGWATLGTPVGQDPVATVLAPLIGGGTAVALVMLVPEASGSGLAHTKAALYISNGYVPFKTVIAKFASCATSIGSGNSLGPEDPALQMGAGVASLLGRAFTLPREHLRMVAPIGAAAGIAAAFNTPITAVLFVIEEVIAAWNASVLGSIVLSAVSAVVVSRWFLGDDPLFRVPAFELRHPSELAVYAVVGLVGGLLGSVFVRALGILRGRLADTALPARMLHPFLAGAVVGVVGLVLPHVMGAGYPVVDNALHDEFGWRMLLADRDERAERLRAGRHGHVLRRRVSCADDLRVHGLRGERQLRHHPSRHGRERHGAPRRPAPEPGHILRHGRGTGWTPAALAGGTT